MLCAIPEPVGKLNISGNALSVILVFFSVSLIFIVCPARKNLGWEGALVDNGFIKNMDLAHLRLYASQWDDFFFEGATTVKS